MTHLNLDASLEVSNYIKTTSASWDQSIVQMADLTKAIALANQASELAPAQSQKILESMADSFANLVQGRAKFVAAHKDMITLKLQSDHVETDFGCWGAGPLTNPRTVTLKSVA